MNARTQAVGEAFQQELGNFEPDGNMEVPDFLQGLSEMWETAGQSINQMADNLGSNHAIDPAVIEELHEHAATVDGLKESAQQMLSTLRVKHEKDIERNENPRPGEEGWDRSRNT